MGILAAVTAGGALSAPVAHAKSKLIETMKGFINESTILTGANENPEQVVGLLITSLLSLLGVLFLILIIYGGYLWMTAQGAEEQIGKAKKIILSASIGVAVILSAYVITYTIIQFLNESTLQAPTTEETAPRDPVDPADT